MTGGGDVRQGFARGRAKRLTLFLLPVGGQAVRLGLGAGVDTRGPGRRWAGR